MNVIIYLNYKEDRIGESTNIIRRKSDGVIINIIS